MIKTEARKTWSDRENFTLQNKFSWTFKSAKTHELPGAPPLDHRQGRCPAESRGPKMDPWTPPMLGLAASCLQCGLCPQIIPHLGIRVKWKCGPPHNILRTPLHPCNISPVYMYSERGINREGFNLKLAMVKTCSTWPLLNKYAL